MDLAEARYAQTGEGNTKQLHGVEPPLIRLRAQDHRIFFREGDHVEISRVRMPDARVRDQASAGF